MKYKLIIAALSVLFITNACQKIEKRGLEDIEKAELAKGIRNDSIFLGLHLGMSNKDFYAVCWDLNKKGVLAAGSGNLSAAYDLNKGELAFPAKMSFYPKFVDDKISVMPVRFAYISWAPWNRETQSDKLLLDVAKLMEKWYGPGFFASPLPEGGKGLVKVAGNRRIVIMVETESEVLVTVTDLTVK